MKFIDYLEPSDIALNVPYQSKKRLFEQLAVKMGENSKESRAIYNALVRREKIGVTSLGNGVALPHGQCLDEKEVRIRIVRLNHPVNFESVDGIKVQLIVCIIFPKQTDETHEVFLKQVGELFKKHRIFREILNCETALEVYKILLNES